MKNFIVILFFAVIPHMASAVALAHDTLCYKVADYGAKGDGRTDDLPALSRLMKEVSHQSVPVKIIFRSNAIYRIGAHTQDCDGRIFINRANNLTIDGRGSTLMVHPSSRAFAIYRSNNVVIRNFKIDYSPLPYTQGRVTKTDSEHFYLEFKIDEGYPLPMVGGEEYYSGGKMVDCITASGENRKFYQGHSWVKEVTLLGDRTYGVRYALRDQRQLRIGDYFCMKVTYPESELRRNEETSDKHELGEFMYTNTGNITALASNGLVLENIVSYASPMMTVVLKGCSNHVIRNCSIQAYKERIVAGCSDGIHLKGNEHQPQILNCYIERTMDDAIHIKMSGDEIKEIYSPRRFKIAHKDIMWDNTNLGTGKEVMLFDLKSSKQLAMRKIASYEPINYREGIVTLDDDVSGLNENVCLYLQSDEEAIIENCGFGTQLQRGILTHQPTKVTNCSIIDNGLGFALGLYSDGIEGPPTQRLTVERCVFRNLVYGGLEVDCPSLNYDQKGCPQLTIQKCIFDLPQGVPVLSVKNSKGVSLKDNIYYYCGELPKEEELFKLDNTRVLKSENNQYIKK